MRPMAVVVVDVNPKHMLELSPAYDQDPVGAVPPDGADPALGERVRSRRAERRADDLDALASEDLVEGAAELTVTIVDQEADRRQPLRQRPGELTGLLSYPRAARVGGASGQMHAPASQLDEAEHVQGRRLHRGGFDLLAVVEYWPSSTSSSRSILGFTGAGDRLRCSRRITRRLLALSWAGGYEAFRRRLCAPGVCSSGTVRTCRRSGDADRGG